MLKMLEMLEKRSLVWMNSRNHEQDTRKIIFIGRDQHVRVDAIQLGNHVKVFQ